MTHHAVIPLPACPQADAYAVLRLADLVALVAELDGTEAVRAL